MRAVPETRPLEGRGRAHRAGVRRARAPAPRAPSRRPRAGPRPQPEPDRGADLGTEHEAGRRGARGAPLPQPVADPGPSPAPARPARRRGGDRLRDARRSGRGRRLPRLRGADRGRVSPRARGFAPRAALDDDLPTVLWLPDLDSPIPDPRLLERAQQVLVDSTADDGDALRRLGELAQGARVHDLAWGRLEFWRAATAAAFEPLERRRPPAPDRAPGRSLRGRRPVRRAAAGRLGDGARRLAPGGARARRRRSHGKAMRPDGGTVCAVAGARPGRPGMRRDREAHLPNGLGRGEDPARGGHQPPARRVRGGAAADAVVRARVRGGARGGGRAML